MAGLLADVAPAYDRRLEDQKIDHPNALRCETVVLRRDFMDVCQQGICFVWGQASYPVQWTEVEAISSASSWHLGAPFPMGSGLFSLIA